MNYKIIASTQSAIDQIEVIPSLTSCWLHTTCADNLQVDRIASLLIRRGCRHFAVSGEDAESIHDRIDSIVLEHPSLKELVLTTWHATSLHEAAESFFAVDCPGGKSLLRILTVLGIGSEKELQELSKVVLAAYKVTVD